jgi:GT2 family glycosyltransferase/glycosyltransferase involved in cell wall biosynthesis
MADILQQDAHAARDAGAAALTVGDFVKARFWFERAYRLVPTDPALMFALAGVLMQLRGVGAARLLTDATQSADTRELWLSLAAAWLQGGNLADAQVAIVRMLSTHVLPAAPSIPSDIVRLICQRLGLPGWCGVAPGPDGLLQWVTDSVGATASVDLQPLRSRLIPKSAGTLTVSLRGIPLLGSPIDLGALSRVEGFVSESDGGLTGWAWCPADADKSPSITIRSDISGKSLRIQAENTDIVAPRPMTRPRGFKVTAEELIALPGPLRIIGDDGRELSGSPVEPGRAIAAARQSARLVAAAIPAIGRAHKASPAYDFPAPANLMGTPAYATAEPDRPVAVVVPVYRNEALTRICLQSALASCPASTVFIVIDDATPEPALATYLDTLAAASQIVLIRNQSNKGFPTSANAGMRCALALSPAHDVILLNSDTTLAPSKTTTWLDRLRRAAHSAPDIGTAAPLSNDASILSYPSRDTPNAAPDATSVLQHDRAAARANAEIVVDIPTSVGFCMYVRRECAIDVGLFREDLFAQGYGEENDFCMRARHLGWRHVAVPGAYVGHSGSASFGLARAPLAARNLAVLERLYPGYRDLIASYQNPVASRDALAPARRRLDMQLWTKLRQQSAVLLVTHDSGGGVERVVQARIAELSEAGQRAIVLRPVSDPSASGQSVPGLCQITDGAHPHAFRNLVFNLPSEVPALAKFLKGDRPVSFEVHHRLGHPQSIMALATKLALKPEFRLHDYASFCPRVTLFGADQKYCGEPIEIATCDACVADAGNRTGEAIGVAALRARSTTEFASASRIIVPSPDMASRLRRHFPRIRPEILPNEPDCPAAPPPPPQALPRRIAVIGGISVEKGFNVLLACARDAANRNLPLEFVLIGHSSDDQRLLATGRVMITGRYDEAVGEALIRDQSTHAAFLPSILPETWGFTLGLAWRAGLRAAVFDLGAMAARVKATGFGMVLPLGLSAAATNQKLLSDFTPVPH